MPSASHELPAAATVRSSALTTSSESPVPAMPSSANGGRSWPRIRTRPGLRYGRGTSGCVTRSRSTARWAIENDSIAPNA